MKAHEKWGLLILNRGGSESLLMMIEIKKSKELVENFQNFLFFEIE